MFDRRSQLVTHERLKELIVRKRQAWPVPELSIGQPRGNAGNKNLQYWEAVGPALDAYKGLCPRIYKLLSDCQGPLPNSDFIATGIYMIGPSPSSAIPHIMFTSEDKKAREAAQKILKQSQLLREHPGMNVGHWREVPHLSAQRQCTISENTDAPERVPHLPKNIDLEVSPWSTSARVRFDFEGYSTTGTTGAIYLRDGRYYCLVPAHMLLPTKSPEPHDKSAPEQDGSEEDCDFGGFASEDDAELDEALSTSAGSLSSLSSRSTEKSDPVRFDSDLSTMSGDVLGNPPKLVPSPPELAMDVYNLSLPPRFPVISVQLDYALMEIPPGLAMQELSKLRKLRSEMIGDLTEGSVAVAVITSQKTLHGLFCGDLSRSWTFAHLPWSQQYEEVYIGQFDNPVRPGDCGSAVCGQHDRKLYGFVITGGVQKNSGYVIPAVNVLKDIQTRLAMREEVAGSSSLRYPPLRLASNGEFKVFQRVLLGHREGKVDSATPDVEESAKAIPTNTEKVGAQQDSDKKPESYSAELPSTSRIKKTERLSTSRTIRFSPPTNETFLPTPPVSEAEPVVEGMPNMDQLVSMQDRNDRLQSEIQSLKKHWEEENKRVQADNLELKDQNKILKSENAALREELSQMRDRLGRYTSMGIPLVMKSGSDLASPGDVPSPPAAMRGGISDSEKIKRRPSRAISGPREREKERDRELERLRSRFDKAEDSAHGSIEASSRRRRSIDASSRRRRSSITYVEPMGPAAPRPTVPMPPSPTRAYPSYPTTPSSFLSKELPTIGSVPRSVHPRTTYNTDGYGDPEDGNYLVHPLPRQERRGGTDKFNPPQMKDPDANPKE